MTHMVTCSNAILYRQNHSNMNITIAHEGRQKSFALNPQIINRRTKVRPDGATEHSITLQDVSHCVVAFCRSRPGSMRLARSIRLGMRPELRVADTCLGLAVLVHPMGWPQATPPEYYLAKADGQVVRAAGVYVPTKAAEVFPATPIKAFSIVPRLPDVPYESVRYQDVRQAWMKDERVGLGFECDNLERGLCRIAIVTASKQTAFDLASDLRRQRVRTLRVNKTVPAIFQELQPSPRESRLLVDGLTNLRQKQQRALEQIGLTLLPNGCYLTSILRWEHARILASVGLF